MSGAPLSVVVAGGVSAFVLAAAEIGWLALKVPSALEPSGGAGSVFSSLAPRAALVGAAIGLALGAAMSAAGRLSELGARWRGRREEWVAGIAAAVLATVAAVFGAALMQGRRAPGGVLTFVILGAVAAGTGWCGWEVVRAAQRVRGWLGDPTTGPARRRALRLIVPAVMAGAAAGLYLVDRSVLVRLYAPFHLALRAAMFIALVAGVIALWALRSGPSRPGPRPWRRAAIAAAIVGALVLFVRNDASSAARTSALTVVALHGAVGSTFVRLASVVEPPIGRRLPARSSPAARPRHDRAGVRSVIAPGANLLIITVDALRADHLGTYGYPRPTSPHLDLLASESLVFERAYTSAPHTSFALTSLLTGQPAMSLSELGVLEGTPTLADLTRVNGYHTAAFFSPAVFFVDGERFKTFEERAFGFESVFPDRFPESSAAALQTDQVLGFLAKQTPERFFAWIHYFAPHEPYLDHPEAGAPFGTAGVDRYDAEIRWTDLHVGRLVRFVRARYPDTIVVLTADHGEEFGEHGGAYHGTTLYDEQTRVPLIISVPGVPARRIAAPVSTTSVVPTLLDLTGIPARWEFDGASLAPWIEDASRAEADLPVAFVENTGQRAAVGGTDKLLCTRKPERCALFDLVSDPAELVDTSLGKPDRFARLMSEIDGWVARIGARRRTDAWKIVSDKGARREDRRSAARSLARSPERSREAELKSAWAAEADPVVRSWLALALGDLGDIEAGTSLAAAPAQAAAVDPELGAHLALARARLQGTAAVPDLAAALTRAIDVNLRCGLMHALAEWPTSLTGATLIREYDVVRSRVCCAEALARLRDPGTVPFLLSRVIDEPYITVQTELVRALGQIRDAAAIPVLEQLRSATPESGLAEVVDLVLRDLAEPSGT